MRDSHNDFFGGTQSPEDTKKETVYEEDLREEDLYLFEDPKTTTSNDINSAAQPSKPVVLRPLPQQAKPDLSSTASREQPKRSVPQTDFRSRRDMPEIPADAQSSPYGKTSRSSDYAEESSDYAEEMDEYSNPSSGYDADHWDPACDEDRYDIHTGQDSDFDDAPYEDDQPLLQREYTEDDSRSRRSRRSSRRSHKDRDRDDRRSSRAQDRKEARAARRREDDEDEEDAYFNHRQNRGYVQDNDPEPSSRRSRSRTAPSDEYDDEYETHAHYEDDPRDSRDRSGRRGGGIPWILQTVLYSALGLGLGLFARYIDLHPSDSTIQSLAVSLSDLPFWMMCAVGISVYSKNGLAAFANVLLFFSFMDIAYYWYSYQYDGTLLMKLFVFWGLLGAASSLLAPFVHYAKSKGVFGFVLSVLILAVQAILTGWSVIGWNFLWFVGSMLFLSRKSIFMTLLMGLAGGLLGIGVWMYLHQIGVSSLLRHSTRTGEESAFMVWIKQTDLSVWLEQLLYRLGMVPGQ